jgi:hypothetical protein
MSDEKTRYSALRIPNTMKAHPYTPQQVIHNLQNMIEQLRDYPPNLEGGPGWCRKQAESIVERGIVGDKLNLVRNPSETP